MTRLCFEVNSKPMHADLSVTEEIDELIFGYEFLISNKCAWTFGKRKIVIDGLSVPLHSRRLAVSVREPVVIPSDTSVNVPVRMPFVNLHTVECDWVTESKQVRPGLSAARTLLSHDDGYAAISFVNVSRVDQSLRCGFALGVAVPCSPDLVRPLVSAGHSSDVQPEPDSNDVAMTESVANEGAINELVSDVSNTQVKCASVHDTDDYSHIQPMIDKLPSSLTPEQREQAIALIKRHADIFSRSEFDVGYTDLITARIITNNQGPIAEPLRRHARIHLDVIDDTIERMKAAGIVEDAASPFAANLVVVARKDDQGNPTTPCITIDYRGLNSITYRDRYPIPNLKDCLHSLDKTKILSVIDMSNSYYQVKLAEQDRDLTAFLTRRGQFRLTRLGQGLTNSPSVFCRLMGLVLKGLTCCLAYIDDTICHSPSFEAHLVDLETVFDRRFRHVHPTSQEKRS